MNPDLDAPQQDFEKPIEGIKTNPPPGVDESRLPPSEPAKTQSPGLNRPPKPPPDLCGPYFGLKTTVDHKWTGTCLVLHRGGQQPQLSFDHEAEQTSEILYDNIFGMTAVRFDVAFAIPDGTGDEKIVWTLEWKEQKRRGAFHIAKWDQKWRGGFFSCNGFDETVPSEVTNDLGFDNVWKHLNSVHDKTPLHVLIWGGDQIYSDFIFKDVPFLKRWLQMEWDTKWKHEFSEDVSKQTAEYYFNTYLENWNRDEVSHALETVPALMQWDDHDIFDGALSYPPECRDSPVMTGLVKNAQIFRLLFQHHTSPDLARKHGFFGSAGHNYIAQLGPRLAAFGMDSRTERDVKTVIKEETWQEVFERLQNLQPTTTHLIVICPIPFSFIRVKVAEKIFEFLKNRAPWVRKLPGIKGTNSIFGLPEFYDDLLDEWCHESHIEERNRNLVRFQKLAESRSLRVTFFSGDVHCAGMSRFRSDGASRFKLRPETDPKLMFTIISSAIVNVAPAPNVCIAYHFLKNKWHPVDKTEEALIEMFERRPEKGEAVRFRKVMPNRNWTYFEEVGGEGSMGDSTNPDQAVNGVDAEKHHHHPHWRTKVPTNADADNALDFFRMHYGFDKKRGYPSSLSKTSDKHGQGEDGEPVHQHRHGMFCHHRKSRKLPDIKPSTESDISATGLKIRMWLESRIKEDTGRQFSAYSLIVPNLNVNNSN